MSFSEILKVTGHVLVNWGTTFGKGRGLFFTFTLRLGAWPTQSPIKWVPAELSPVIKSVRK
jgi:hypothetical protein